MRGGRCPLSLLVRQRGRNPGVNFRRLLESIDELIGCKPKADVQDIQARAVAEAVQKIMPRDPIHILHDLDLPRRRTAHNGAILAKRFHGIHVCTGGAGCWHLGSKTRSDLATRGEPLNQTTSHTCRSTTSAMQLVGAIVERGTRLCPELHIWRLRPC